MLRIAVMFAVGAAAAAMLTSGYMPGLVESMTQSAPSQFAAPPQPIAQPAALAPAPSYGEVAIAADPGGQYSTAVVVNGQEVRMMVDTGATMVVMSSQTASRLGLRLFPGDYKGHVQTANGVARVAAVRLGEIQVGSIALYNIDAWVLDGGAGNVDLLGMSFLKRLSSVEQKSGRLILRQ
jgi:aspartyl protease family protein